MTVYLILMSAMGIAFVPMVIAFILSARERNPGSE